MKLLRTKRTFKPTKLTPKQYIRKGKCMRYLVKEIETYYRGFSRGLPFEVVNRKFNRSFLGLGGIRDAIEQLEMDGSLQFILRVSGRYELFPAGINLEACAMDLKLADAVQIRIIG